MERGTDPKGAPPQFAIHRRRVPVPIARVWENVYDWEHLPWLHRESFGAIELEASGSWGWRARVSPPGHKGPMCIELLTDCEAGHYVTRTLEGPGAGIEIWTALAAIAPDATEVEVRFCAAGLDATASDRVGSMMVALYTQLWDQDEAMMCERERLAAKRHRGGERVSLGDVAALREGLPKVVRVAGERFLVYDHPNSGLRARSLVCPHWQGPLDLDGEDAGRLVCPWHGYRFGLESGANCDGRRLRLEAPRAIEVREHEAWLASPQPLAEGAS